MRKKTLLTILNTILFYFVLLATMVYADVLNVPGDYSSISSAISAASDGDIILIDNGTYSLGSISISSKKITIASNYIFSGDEADINGTVINGTSSSIFLFTGDDASGCQIIGLTMRDAAHMVDIEKGAFVNVLHCKFYGGTDQVSFDDGGGYIANCYFTGSSDDGIDADHSRDWTVEYCEFVNVGGDGIEVRLHNDTALMKTHIFRYNYVFGSDEDGIQLIDYSNDSYRTFYIHHNVIVNNKQAGIGCMAGGNTDETFQGSPMIESAYIYNNTIVGNACGISGAPNMLVLNNIISNNGSYGGLRNIEGNSIVDYCAVYNNSGGNYGSGVNRGSNNLSQDPMLNADWTLLDDSPCIDAGTAFYTYESLSLDMSGDDYNGSAPDMGAKEYDSGEPAGNQAPIVDAGQEQLILEPINTVNLDGSVTDDGLPVSGTLTLLWEKDSGPGTVIFEDVSSPITTGAFSQQGSYELRLTGDDSELQTSDKVKIHYVKDYVDSTVNIGQTDVFIEAEDYRFLVGTAEVVSHAGASLGQIIESQYGQGTWAYSEYQALSLYEGTYYVWVSVSGNSSSENEVYVAVRDISNAQSLAGTTDGSFGYDSWQKATFTGIPEGIYPLRIKAKEEGVMWDKIFITTDKNRHPLDMPPVEVRVSAGEDDAEENANGSMYLDSSDLELVFDGSDQTVGMRFANVDIPQGATITDAYIQFQVDEPTNGTTDLIIKGHSIDDAPPFTESTNNITSRSMSTATVDWSPAPWNTVGEAGQDQRTPNIASVIQEIVKRPGWYNGNAMVLIITGAGARVAESFNGDREAAPLIHIEYDIGQNPPQCCTLNTNVNGPGNVIRNPDKNLYDEGELVDITAIPPQDYEFISWNGDPIDGSTSTVETILMNSDITVTANFSEILQGTKEINVEITASSDDAEETSEGKMRLTSSDLELTNDRGNQTIGMRFVNVDIPQRATIVNAYIQFQVDEVSEGPCNLTIKGENVDDSSTFIPLRKNISSRDMTSAAVNWSPEDWLTVGDQGEDQRTPDIKSIIQEIVNRSNWSSYNALSIIITGTGKRTAESYNGDQSAAPLLHVEYSDGNLLSDGEYSLTAIDDAEENVNDGTVDVLSSDLELVRDDRSTGAFDQIIGIRFKGIEIPSGASIIKAYLKFTSKSNESELNTSLTIMAHDISDASSFNEANLDDISSRSKTLAEVSWKNLPAWTVGSVEKSPDISSIIQELVDIYGGISASQAIGIMISGIGQRRAFSIDGAPSKADKPLLYVAYSM